MTNYQAFDSFADEAELNDEPSNKGFTINDENFDLPSTLPAAAVLRMMRKIKTDEIGAIDTFLTSVLGAEQYERLLDTGIALDKLMKIVEWIVQQYSPEQVSNPNPKAQQRKK